MNDVIFVDMLISIKAKHMCKSNVHAQIVCTFAKPLQYGLLTCILLYMQCYLYCCCTLLYIGVLSTKTTIFFISSEGIREVLEEGTKKLVEFKRKAKHCTVIVKLVVCGSSHLVAWRAHLFLYIVKRNSC